MDRKKAQFRADRAKKYKNGTLVGMVDDTSPAFETLREEMMETMDCFHAELSELCEKYNTYLEGFFVVFPNIIDCPISACATFKQSPKTLDKNPTMVFNPRIRQAKREFEQHFLKERIEVDKVNDLLMYCRHSSPRKIPSQVLALMNEYSHLDIEREEALNKI